MHLLPTVLIGANLWAAGISDKPEFAEKPGVNPQVLEIKASYNLLRERVKLEYPESYPKLIQIESLIAELNKELNTVFLGNIGASPIANLAGDLLEKLDDISIDGKDSKSTNMPPGDERFNLRARIFNYN